MKLEYDRYAEYERIQELGLVMPFTNTERINFGCPRLWSYQNIQNYVIKEKSIALSYGIIWHKLLELILLESQKNDQLVSEDRLNAIVDNDLSKIIEDYFLAEENDESYQEQLLFGNIDDIIKRIKNAITGWWLSWQVFLERFRILYVELPVVAPIIQADGNTAYFETYIVDEGPYLRPARIGELEYAFTSDLPYYKVGKIDVLVEERCSGDLWICDHKTSGTPAMYEKNIPFDVQLPSYASLVDYEKTCGKLQHLKDRTIRGVIYDISHSKIKGIPELLKSGKLSKAKNAGTSSWIYQKAIEKYELPISQYKDHLEYLKNNADPKKNFQRYYYLTDDDIDRCVDEDYGIASAMADKRKRLVEIAEESIVDFNSIAYRYPACQKYGNCTFSTFCLANNQPSVIQLEQDDKIKWITDPPIPNTTIPF